MNLRELSEAMDIDVETYVEVLSLFYDTALEDLSRIDKALQDESGDGVANAAHSIKGAALNLGLDNIVKAAKEIEGAGREKNLAGAEKTLTSLREKVEAIGTFIRERS